MSGNAIHYHHNSERRRDTTYFPGGTVRFDTVTDSHAPIWTKYSPTAIDTAFYRAYIYDQAGRVGEIDRLLGSTGVGVYQFKYDGVSEINWEVAGTAASTYSCPPAKPDCHLDTGVTALDSVTYTYDSAKGVLQPAALTH